jgi:putative DNA primase/helicase
LGVLEMHNHNELANQILTQYTLITFEDTREIYYWNKETGLYESAEIMIEKITQSELGEDCKTRFVTEVKDSIRRQTYTKRELVGSKLSDIPLNNCIYDFETETTRPYTSKDIFLFKHPIKWLDIEEEPFFINPIDIFLEQVTENQKYCLLLKEIAGYCFYRAMPFQNFFILIGKGGNGKSVYLNILRKMLGEENVSNQSLQALSDGGFAIASLYQKNANIFGDLPKKAFQDVSKIKELTGDDTIEANQKFKAYIKFKSFAKLISSCNEIPESPDNSDGFHRRSVTITFPNSFEGKENRNLLNELCTEINLFWFFKSCMNAFKGAKEMNEWIVNETIEEKRDKYLVNSNSAVAFLGMAVEYDPDSQITVDAIYKEYSAYCKVKKTTIKDENVFFKSLYNFFGNKAYKRRMTRDELGSDSLRVYVVQGLDWKPNYSKLCKLSDWD